MKSWKREVKLVDSGRMPIDVFCHKMFPTMDEHEEETRDWEVIVAHQIYREDGWRRKFRKLAIRIISDAIASELEKN